VKQLAGVISTLIGIKNEPKVSIPVEMYSKKAGSRYDV
jgi:hypothetical protein